MAFMFSLALYLGQQPQPSQWNVYIFGGATMIASYIFLEMRYKEQEAAKWVKNQTMTEPKLPRVPFQVYREQDARLNDEGVVFTVRLNKAEKMQLYRAKKVLKQTKNGTALKQLAAIGSAVLQDRLIGGILRLVLKNKGLNVKIGITDDSIEYEEK